MLQYDLGQGEWVWSTGDGFAAPYSAFLPSSGTAAHQYSEMQQAHANANIASDVSAWTPQADTLDVLWGAMAIDDNLGIPVALDEFPATPLSDLNTPSLTYSPSSDFPLGAARHSVPAVSSSASSPSVPDTPAILETNLYTQVQTQDWSAQAKQSIDHDQRMAPAQQILMSALDIATLPQTIQAPLPLPATSVPACVYPAGQQRPFTSASSITIPTLVPLPQPGWLDPNVVPLQIPVQTQQDLLPLPGWSNVPESAFWMAPATAPAAPSSRYEPYRNASVSSASSSASQIAIPSPSSLSAQRLSHAEASTSRNGSVTGVSLSWTPPIGLTDRVPAVSDAPLRSERQSSLPTRRSRSALSSAFLQQEGGSLKARRMPSRASLRSPLASMFAQEPSPTLSEQSLLLRTQLPAGLVYSPPCTPLRASLAGEAGDEGKGKIARHHHRIKLQRSTLNEVVTALQRAYKLSRRLHCLELDIELDRMQLQEAIEVEEPTWSTSGALVAGETKETRKNRQKAESKMRMRRKEISQFTALVGFAKIAYASIVEGGGEGVAEAVIGVFLECKEQWGTLVALEKRLFHTVRISLGLQELMVKKLIEALIR